MKVHSFWWNHWSRWWRNVWYVQQAGWSGSESGGDASSSSCLLQPTSWLSSRSTICLSWSTTTLSRTTTAISTSTWSDSVRRRWRTESVRRSWRFQSWSSNERLHAGSTSELWRTQHAIIWWQSCQVKLYKEADNKLSSLMQERVHKEGVWNPDAAASCHCCYHGNLHVCSSGQTVRFQLCHEVWWLQLL